MRTIRRLAAAATLVVGVTLGVSSDASAVTAVQMQGAQCFDTQTVNCGGWDQTTPGVTARPFVKYLAVANGGPETVVVDNRAGQVATPTPNGGTRVYALVSPMNACRQGQTPGPGTCYATPNRVGVSLWQDTSGSGNWSDDLTSAPSAPVVNTDSTVRMIIGLRAGYTSLRWSWVNGEPTYWRSDVSPLGGEVEVRFRPRTMPWMNSGGCSQIPVSTCDINQADAERLMPQMILSMDDTLNPILGGALFGSSGAFIGSLESSPISPGQAPTLTYGIAAPHLNANGTDRRGTFYALVPNPILQLFGTSSSAFDPGILSVDRTNGSGTFDLGWSAWEDGANGTAGRFLTITNISFSAPKFEVRKRTTSSTQGSATGSGATGAATPRTRAPRTLKAKRAVGLRALASDVGLGVPKGAQISARVSTPRICAVTSGRIRGLAPGTCRAIIVVTPRRGKQSKRSVSFQVVK